MDARTGLMLLSLPLKHVFLLKNLFIFSVFVCAETFVFAHPLETLPQTGPASVPQTLCNLSLGPLPNIVLGRSHSFDERRFDPKTRLMPVFKRNRRGELISYPELVAEALPSLNSVRYYSKRGAVPPDAEVVLVLVHGMGHRIFSHAGSMLDPLMVFNSTYAKGEGLAQDLKRLPWYTKVAAQAIDLPGCGGGPCVEGFRDLKTYAHWLKDYADHIRRVDLNGREIPIVFLGRSSSPALIAEMNRIQAVDGIIGMSAAHPAEEHVRIATKKLLGEEAEGKSVGASIGTVVLDHEIIRFIDDLFFQIPPVDPASYFGGVPTFLMFGNRDTAVATELQDWKHIAEQSGAEMRIYKEGGHDLFAVNDGVYKDDGRFIMKQRPRNTSAYSKTSWLAYSDIMKFLSTKILKRQILQTQPGQVLPRTRFPIDP